MSWRQDDVVDQVKAIIADHLEREADIGLGTELVADLGIDSLGVMEVLAELEDKFELTIADKELRNATTVADVVDTIVKRLRKEGRFQS